MDIRRGINLGIDAVQKEIDELSKSIETKEVVTQI